MLNGRGVSFLHRCRKKKGVRANPGGGVSIAFKRAKVTLKEFPVKRVQHKILCAKGKLANHTTPFFVFAVYLPPKATAKQTADCLELISQAILRIKTELRESLILIGGDFNKRDLTPAIGDYVDLAVLDSPPTRGDAHLDITACNFAPALLSCQANQPLETEDGQSVSDHAFLSYKFNIRHTHEFQWLDTGPDK